MATQYTINTKFAAVDGMTAVLGRMQAKVAGFRKSISSMQATTGSMLRGMGDAQIMRGLSLGAVGLGVIGRSAVKTAAEFEAIKTAISFVSGDSANAEKNLSFLSDTVRGLKLDYSVTAESLKRFLGAMKATDIPAERQRDMFYKMAAATRVLGLDGVATERVFYALGEMFSKGQVMSQELKLQLGNSLPGAVAMFANSMNLPQKQFRKLQEAGKIGTEHIGGFIDHVYEQFSKGVPKAVTTMTAKLTALGNSWKFTLETIGLAMDKAGVIEMLEKVMEGIQGWVSANQDLIRSGFQTFLQTMESTFKWIYNNWDGIVTGLKIYLGLWAGLKVINIALGAFNTAIQLGGVLMNPAGAVIVGALALGAAIWTIYDNTVNANKAMKKYQDSLKYGITPAVTFDDYKKIWEKENKNVADEFDTKIKQQVYIAAKNDPILSYRPLDSDRDREVKRYRYNESQRAIERLKEEREARKRSDYEAYLARKESSSLTAKPALDFIQSAQKGWGNMSQWFPASMSGSSLYDTESQKPINIESAKQRAVENSSVIEIKLTTDKGTSAEVVSNRGASPVVVTTNN